mmetsp:Transcript_47076/g.134787  ORF Transcript_47076/g.134787 Transcript_47076/m.134787 type:complete len:331 (+) Transcript_47076:1477-2469(+)
MDGAVVVHLGDREHVVVPVDLVILHARWVQLLPQRGRHRIGGSIVREAAAIQIAHWDVDHPAMAPEPARMDREPGRQQPQLGGHGRDATQVVNTQEREPELRPRGGVQAAAVLMQERPPKHARGVVHGRADESERDVVQSAAEHGAWRLEVRSPATVLLLVVPQIRLRRPPICRRHRLRQFARAGDICRDHEARQQEVGPAVISRPLAVTALDHLIESKSFARGLQGVARNFGLVRLGPLPSLQPRRPKNAVARVRVGSGIEGVLLRRALGTGGVEGPNLLARDLVGQQVFLRLLLHARGPTHFHRHLRTLFELHPTLQTLLLWDGISWV